MLVFTRKQGESVVIEVPPSSETRRVVVTVARGNRVKLGFDADRDIAIDRKEAGCLKPANEMRRVRSRC